jgi:hypothetical protein
MTQKDTDTFVALISSFRSLLSLGKFCATTFSFSLVFLSTQAQLLTTDPKHENYYSATPIESEELRIQFFDTRSQQVFSQTKVEVTNKTSDYLLFLGSETIFQYPFGEVNPSDKNTYKGVNMWILPDKTETRTLKVLEPGKNFHVDMITFIPHGFYRVSSQGTIQEGPVLALSQESKEIAIGSFSCTLHKWSKEKKEIKISLQCAYHGQQVGIVAPQHLVCRDQNGHEYANTNQKEKIVLLLPGESTKIMTVFAIPLHTEDPSGNPLEMVWKNTFSESKKVPIPLKSTRFVFDRAETDVHNK